MAAGTLDDADVPVEWLRPLPAGQSTLEVTEAVTARAGMAPRFAQAWQTGQRVAAAGTLLGWNAGEPFHTPYADCTLIMPSVEHVTPGMTIVRLARDLDANA
jgi:hypothetical protein